MSADATTFVTRRGGRATFSSAASGSNTLGTGEQVVVRGTEGPSVATYAAADLDAWDRWNYDRTDRLVASASARYVSSDVYGLDALDRYGRWNVEPDYGPVWTPAGVGPNWAPYTAGRWIWDAFYGWSWIDDAPWGWAPCHYGRWVRVRGSWGWAPGPVLVAPFYAPAVVAFFGGSQFSIGIGLGVPAVGWVALGWGEPLLPWWGSVGFVGVPWWGGWGGPRYVNCAPIYHGGFVHAGDIHRYWYAHTPHALGFAREDAFGRGHYRPGQWRDVNPHLLQPVHGRLPVRPVAASLSPRSGHAARPPEAVQVRRVVTRSGRDGIAAAERRVPGRLALRERVEAAPWTGHLPPSVHRAPAAEGGVRKGSPAAPPPHPVEFRGNGSPNRQASLPNRWQRPAPPSSPFSGSARVDRQPRPSRPDAASPRVASARVDRRVDRATPPRVPDARSRDFRQPARSAPAERSYAAVPRPAPRRAYEARTFAPQQSPQVSRGAAPPRYAAGNQSGGVARGLGRPQTRSVPQSAPGGPSRGAFGGSRGHGASRAHR